MMFSAMGGVDIEQVAEEHPDKIARLVSDVALGPFDFQLRKLVAEADLEKNTARQDEKDSHKRKVIAAAAGHGKLPRRFRTTTAGASSPCRATQPPGGAATASGTAGDIRKPEFLSK